MLSWVKQYSTPLVVLLGVIVSSLWVHDHTQQAVQRALLKQQVDSIAQKVKQDSISAALRDSIAQATIARQSQDEAAARAFAQAAHTSMHQALDSLSKVQTAADSIVIYQTALAQADTVIAQQKNAILAADAQIVTLKSQVLDRDGQIVDLRKTNADLIEKLKKATQTSVWNGTAFKIIDKLLVAKGAYDVFRGR
jgi:hypothetical protein